MRFINLRAVVLNTKYIYYINKKENIYIVNLISNNLSGMFCFGSGWLENEPTSITIDKTKNPQDYDTITKFINAQEQNQVAGE